MRRAEGRGRPGFSLTEVLMAIIVIAVALGALLEVLSYSLRMSLESAQMTRELMGAHAQVQDCFFKGREFFDNEDYYDYDYNVDEPKIKPGAVKSGMLFAPVPVDLELLFSHPSKPSKNTRIPLKAYDMGKNKPLRIYRLNPPLS